MKLNLSAALVGLLFSFGLGLSGMTQPQKVIGFLDITGNWDPSLMFVMLGAIGVHFFLYRKIRKRVSPLFTPDWKIPEKKEITPSLIVGSLIFGAGWGLGGYCPGPVIASLGSLQFRPVLFVISMSVGMLIFRMLNGKFKFNDYK